VGEADSLWLEHEPTLEEIKAAFDSCNFPGLTPGKAGHTTVGSAEIVFCGYGEPMERADTVVDVCEYIKSKSDSLLRLNTNGLVRLINPEFEINRLQIFDSISISLNADNAEDYMKVTNPRFGLQSFGAMLDFVKAAMKFSEVSLTVVKSENVNVEKCRSIAEELGVSFRVRTSI